MDNDLQTDFELLVMQHKSTIYSVCYMYADAKAEADDLSQETLINLWKGFPKYRRRAAECNAPPAYHASGTVRPRDRAPLA